MRDINVGYWASFFSAQKQVASGNLNGLFLTNAKATMRNTAIQETLSIIFLLSVAILLVICIYKIVKIVQTNKVGDKYTSEEPFVESQLFETSSFIATDLEHKILKVKAGKL